MRAPNGPLISKSSNAMPCDKPNPHGQRPFVPALGLSSTKTVNATPLTPRVAGSIQSNISTPLLRRAIRPDITPNNGPQRDERTTPVTPFLSNNITPRSGSRKSRVDSASSTPTVTPAGTPATESLRSPADNLVYGGGSLGVVPHDGPQTKPTVSFSAHTSEVGSLHERPQPQLQSQVSKKFFYASDVKPSNAQPLRQRPMTQKHNNFLYANGNAIPSSDISPGPVPNVSGVEERGRAKFFHANGTPDTVILPLQSFSRPGSAVSTASSYILPPRFAPQSPISTQRPASPTKYSENVANYLPPSVSTHSSPLVSPSYTPLQSNANETTTRNGFDSSSAPLRHVKSRSIGSLDLHSPAAKLTEGSDLVGSRDARPGFVDRTSMSSIDDGSESIIVDDMSSISGFMSPVKAGGSLERMNELAANARRERKVLDLEITNSSLAAINRTLEREMRKQTAELRRYRRLSRSGRLSINTVMSRSSTGSLLMANGIDMGQLSDMSEEEEDADDDDSELDSADDGALSPTALAESDARHRKRDEERLQLDLTKHQQLLVDSQKMNQSLKRCLGWTEELINAGKRALAYQINVSDVELGGRVLIADEDYQDVAAMDVEPSILNTNLDDNEDSFQNLGKDDRDSGVDLGQQYAGLGIDGEIRIIEKSS